MNQGFEPHTPDAALIDPDPFTVAMLWISAASLLLQFVQVVRNPNVSPSRPDQSSLTPVDRLETELIALQKHLKGLSRAIDRGAREPESEFYDVKFRIGAGILGFEIARHAEFSQNLSQAFARIGNVALWINTILAHNPQCAAYIGRAFLGELTDSTEKLNELIASGGSNRELIYEARKIIELALTVVADLLDRN